MRIEIKRAILMPRLADFLGNSAIHFRMFLYLVTCFLRVTVLLLCRSQARTISSQFTKMERVSLIQLVTGIATKLWLSGNMFPNIKICENGWSNFSENLRMVGIKIARVKSISITKSIIKLNLNCSVEVCGDRGRFSLHSLFIEKFMLQFVFKYKFHSILAVCVFIPVFLFLTGSQVSMRVGSCLYGSQVSMRVRSCLYGSQVSMRVRSCLYGSQMSMRAGTAAAGYPWHFLL